MGDKPHNAEPKVKITKPKLNILLHVAYFAHLGGCDGKDKEISKNYPREVARSDSRLSLMTGNARRTIVLSNAPMRVPSITMPNTRLLCFGELETG